VSIFHIVMFKKLLKDNKAQIGALIPAAIVITVLVVLFTIIPVIGYNVDASWTMPAYSAAGGQWNSTTLGNSAITNASELWTTNSPLLSLAVLIGIIFIAIGALLRGRGIGGGGGGL